MFSIYFQQQRYTICVFFISFYFRQSGRGIQRVQGKAADNHQISKIEKHKKITRGQSIWNQTIRSIFLKFCNVGHSMFSAVTDFFDFAKSYFGEIEKIVSNYDHQARKNYFFGCLNLLHLLINIFSSRFNPIHSYIRFTLYERSGLLLKQKKKPILRSKAFIKNTI